jgi:HK97 gp10 family phage protein
MMILPGIGIMKEIEIKGDINKSINWLETNAPRYFNAALYSGAAVIKDQARKNFVSSMPKSTIPNPKYNDLMVDAIRNTRSLGDEVTVHTMGTRATGSGTYRARFFEGGTKDRYQKTYAGIPLKKKRYLGHVKPLHFFSSAVTSTQSLVIQAMNKVIDNLYKNANS